jgi:hypothetical protein
MHCPNAQDALLISEAAQLCRLTDLADPLVSVLLLLPGPPNPDVLAYWDKILQVGWQHRFEHQSRFASGDS